MAEPTPVAPPRAAGEDRRVVVDLAEGIARVRLARPTSLNALTLATLDDLVAVAHGLRRDRTLRAVILSGEGDAFCAGLDIAAATRDPKGVARAFVPRPWRGTNTFQEACWAWRRLPVPVIAAVHGHCLGGGLQLALAADLRITTPDARWSVLEARWGLVPDMAGVQALSELVPVDVAKRLALTGERITGQEAHRLGLATQVADDPVAAADELVALLVSRSPDALAATKRLFGRTWHRSPRATFAAERREQLALLLARNTRAAGLAARSGEPPRYRPRPPRLTPWA